ncbi:MAG: DUF2961 domain-containing protein [Candidatus Alcyoniella australis]|nr:DUF2961 domain-containing protein [Candidatus Alcyoniella australis]
MPKHLSALIVCCALCAAGPALCADDLGPTGAARLLELWELPRMPLYAQTLQTSSHDPLGGNLDGFTGLFSPLYRDEQGQRVLLDVEGPGCVYDLWFTLINFAKDLRCQVDGELLVDMPIADVFNSVQAPFIFPLAGNDDQSSGGFYSYAPICFEHSLKLATSGRPHFFHALYQRYPEGSAIEPYDPEPDPAKLSALLDLLDPTLLGRDPKTDLTSSVLLGAPALEPGQSAELAALEGAGWIAALRLGLAGLSLEQLEQVQLQIFFDGAQQPQVSARLSLLCGASGTWEGMRSLLAGIYDDPVLGPTAYLYFPMPYFKGARVMLHNASELAAPIEYSIALRNEPPLIDALTFHALQREQYPTLLGRDYIVLDVPGRGVDLGQVQRMIGADLSYLEGDERIYVDGSRWPAIYGTGTEDYYQGGWYFDRGPFTLATHGNANHLYLGLLEQSTCYRLHLGDAIVFRNGIVHGIEHDMFNIYSGEHYASVAFYYGVDDPARVVRDEIDVGQPNSEAAHDAQFVDSKRLNTTKYYFEGDQDLAPALDNGRLTRGSEQWTVRIHPDNDGLIIRRLSDMGHDRQRAQVLVDGEPAGIWYQARTNRVKRWIEDEFFVRPELTRGKRELRITLEILGGPDARWSAHHYWIDTLHQEIASRIEGLAAEQESIELCPGDNAELGAVGLDWLGAEHEISGLCGWTSSDEAVAHVENGLLLATNPGAVLLTPWLLGKSGTTLIVSVRDCDQDDDDQQPAPSEDDDQDADPQQDDGCG